MEDLTAKQPLYKKLFGDKNFYKLVIAVALPILIQNTITNFVSLLDNIMVGKVGTEEMSGVSIANQLLFVFNLAIFGATSGVGIFTAQYFGSHDDKGMKESIRFSMYWALLVLAFCVILFGSLAKPLISLFLTETDSAGDIDATLNYGVRYLYFMLIGLLPFTITQVYSGALRSAQKTVSPMVAGIIAVVVNLFLNYVLIYGKFGAPVMGVEGAAIATVVSRYVEAIILVSYSHIKSNELFYFKGIWKSLKVTKSNAKIFIIKGFPIFINELLWSLGLTMIAQCYSMRGLNAVAAVNITNTLNNLFSSGYISMGAAVGIIIGNILGANQIQKARDTSVKLLVFSTLFCTVLAGIFIGLGWVFPNLYNTTDEVKELSKYLIIITACFVPLHAMLNAIYFTIRAGGKTFITFMFDSFYTWAIPVVTAVIISRATSLELIPFYLIVQCVDVIKLTVGFILFRSDIWCKNIVKV